MQAPTKPPGRPTRGPSKRAARGGLMIQIQEDVQGESETADLVMPPPVPRRKSNPAAEKAERVKRQWDLARSVLYRIRFARMFVSAGKAASLRRQQARLAKAALGLPAVTAELERRRRLASTYRRTVVNVRGTCDPWSRSQKGASPQRTQSAAKADPSLASGQCSIFIDGLVLRHDPPKPRRLMSSHCVANAHMEIRGEVEQRLRQVAPVTAQPVRVVCVFDTIMGTSLRHVLAEFANPGAACRALVEYQKVSLDEGGAATTSAVVPLVRWRRCTRAWVPQLGQSDNGITGSWPGLADQAAPEQAATLPTPRHGKMFFEQPAAARAGAARPLPKAG